MIVQYLQAFLLLYFYLLLATMKRLKVQPITVGEILLIASFNLLMNSLPFITLPPQQISPVIASKRIRSATIKVLCRDESEEVTVRPSNQVCVARVGQRFVTNNTFQPR